MPSHPKLDTMPAAHAPHPQLPPTAVLAHVQTGNERAVAAQRAKEPLPSPLPRPSGAGRFVVAVITCAEVPMDAPRLLGLRTEDVLLLSNAGAQVDAASVELLEWAVETERLSLCVLLTHANCRVLVPGTPGGEATQGTRRPRPPHVALARERRERLVGSSLVLQRALAQGRFQVTAASIDSATGTIDWLVPKAETRPIAPVK